MCTVKRQCTADNAATHFNPCIGIRCVSSLRILLLLLLLLLVRCSFLQVAAGWEALLYLRSAIMSAAPPAAGGPVGALVLGPLSDFVTTRLARATSGSTDRDAAKKKFIRVRL
jgi:hypothetical protein